MMLHSCERAGCSCPALGRQPIYDVVTLALCPGCAMEIAEDAPRFEATLDRRTEKARKLDVRKAALSGAVQSAAHFQRMVEEADAFAAEIVRLDAQLRLEIRAWAKESPVRHTHKPENAGAPS